MKRLVIHIGMHKTGSSSIQETFSLNRELLKQHKLIYPDFGKQWGRVNHSLLCQLALSKKGYWYAKKYCASSGLSGNIDELKAEAWEILSKRLISHQAGTLIISAEELSVIGDSGAPRLAELAYQHFDDVKVLAYARTPLQWMTSMISGQIRRGKRLSALYDKMRLPEYRKRFEPYFTYFGDDFSIKLYRKDALYRGCVVADILHHIGEADGLYDSLDLSRVHSNSGISDKTVVILDRANGLLQFLKLENLIGDSVRFVLLYLLKPLSGKFVLPKDIEDKFAALTTEDWKWVEARLYSGGPVSSTVKLRETLHASN